MMLNKSELMFDEKYLENHNWLPNEADRIVMGDQAYAESVNEYNKAAILYSNLFLHWDSCDCGDGFGCSHGSWVYEITNGIPDQKIEYFDDGFSIQGDKTLVTIENSKKITFLQFEQLCAIAGFKIEKNLLNDSAN